MINIYLQLENYVQITYLHSKLKLLKMCLDQLAVSNSVTHNHTQLIEPNKILKLLHLLLNKSA